MNAITKKLNSDFSRSLFNNVAFYGKVNIRRKLLPKKSKYSSFIDFDYDFDHESDLQPPDPITPSFVEDLRRLYLSGGQLSRRAAYVILSRIENLYRSQPICVDVRLPKEAIINICGDIHGQYYDLLKILRLRGTPGPSNYFLFNGDIVDRGEHSVECLFHLFVLKLCYPSFVFLNRGNHESATMNIKNGFEKELRTKYNDAFLFEYIAEVFRWMPVAHVIENRIMVVHGGIPANLKLREINQVSRPIEPEENPIVAALLWSDPTDRPGVRPSTRGIGNFFGPDITKQFLDSNGLLCLIRSHSEITEGVGLSHEGCYTVYSAPNKEKKIIGGVLAVEGKYLEIQGNVFSQTSRSEVEEEDGTS